MSSVLLSPLTSRGVVTAVGKGRIVARDTSKNVVGLGLAADGSLIVAHHEGLAASPGGITQRGPDFASIARRVGVTAPMDVSGARWLLTATDGAGELASVAVADPRDPIVREVLPLRGPLAWVSATSFVAHTPAPRGAVDRATWKFVREPGWKTPADALAALALPPTPSLVLCDLHRRAVRSLVEASPVDPFRHGALSVDRGTYFACTDFGRVVAVRLEDGAVLFEIPSLNDSRELSLKTAALSPDGSRLVCAGAGARGVRVLDTSSGALVREVPILALLDRAQLTKARHWYVLSSAFHPSGWVALGTNTGTVALLDGEGNVSAFKASSTAVTALAFRDEGAELVSGGHEACLRVWRITTPRSPA